MKKLIYLSLALLMAAAVESQAQSRTSYFVRNSTQSHEFNASFAPQHGYMGFPLLSNIDFQLGSNLGLSNFLYPLSNGKTGLWMNSEVTTEQFMSGIRENNTLGMKLNYRLLDVGFYTGRSSFWTVSVGLKTDIDFSLPGELFRFTKVGMSENPTVYNIKNLGIAGEVFGQVSLGYSRGFEGVLRGLRVGAKANLLVGLADIHAQVDNLNLYLGTDRWSASSKASAYIYGTGISPVLDDEGYLSGFNFNPQELGIGGYGASFDIGASYRFERGPLKGLRLSASVTDLGFVTWTGENSIMLTAEQDFTYQGIEQLGPETDFESVISDMEEELVSMFSFRQTTSVGSQTSMITATMYAGVDYSFLRDKMNVGLLYSRRFGGILVEDELTLAWNWAPTRAFDIALSYSLMKTHSTLGWLITFNPRRGVGIFIGSDFTPLNYVNVTTDQLPFKLPVPKNELIFDVHCGVTISFGGSNSRYESTFND